MKKLTFALILLLPLFCSSQTSLKDIRKRSYEMFVYRISADSAEKFIRKDTIPVDKFLSTKASYVFPIDSFDERKLEKGHYVLLSVEDNELVASIYAKTDLVVYSVNNQYRVQIVVQDEKGKPVEAEVTVNDKRAKFNASSQTFFVRQKNPDDAFVKVCTNTDTTFIELWAEEELDKTLTEQRLENFTNSEAGRIITWIPRKIANVFSGKNYHHYSYRSNTYKFNKRGTNGYFVFNQPKYKLTDTVKFKAYLVNRQRQYKKTVSLYLQYYAKDHWTEQKLSTLAPASPGAFIFSFPLSDTLVNDLQYTIVLRDKKKRQLLKGSFKTEDYIPDEVTEFKLRSSKDEIFEGDSLDLYASANDANGLSLLDGKVRLFLTTSKIIAFDEDSVYVNDTLYTEEKPLASDGETKLSIPSQVFPRVQASVSATCIFTNANNETHEESRSVDYRYRSKELFAEERDGDVIAEFRVNGKSQAAQGYYVMKTDDELKKEIKYPAILKINPLADEYVFYTTEQGKLIDSTSLKIDHDYYPQLVKIGTKDSVGFILSNPKKIPVQYSVFDGNRMITAGRGEEENIKWIVQAKHYRKVLRVKWQFYWAGEEKQQEQEIVVLYKLLDIDVQSATTIFPGQKDTIKIKVKDFKNRPTLHANLTAFSYNNQLQKDIRIPQPPYLGNYRRRPFILHDKYDYYDAYITKRYPVGYHEQWKDRFGLDSLLYYQMMFTQQGLYDAATPIGDYLCQVAVHVHDRGVRKQVVMLYLNRNLVYYNGVTDKSIYAFPVYPGYVQIGIRLQDKYIEIDSVYLQSFYKHDLVFDIHHLPEHSSIIEMPSTLTNEERNLLESSLFQLANDPKTDHGFIWQGLHIVRLSNSNRHLVGPFTSFDSLSFYAPSDFDIKFKFEPHYEYTLSKQVERLEKKNVFPSSAKEIKIITEDKQKWILGDTISNPPIITYKPPVTKKLFIKLNSAGAESNSNGSIQWKLPEDTLADYIILLPANGTPLVYPGWQNRLKTIPQGVYQMYAVTKNSFTTEPIAIEVKENTTVCIDLSASKFIDHMLLIERLIAESEEQISTSKPKEITVPKKEQYKIATDSVPITTIDKGAIRGRVFENKGLPIVGALIMIKNTKTGTSSNSTGKFVINQLRPGNYTISVAYVGYEPKDIEVTVNAGQIKDIQIALTPSVSRLQEVVVIGYGVGRRKDLTGAVSFVNGYLNFNSRYDAALQGKALGVMIGEPGAGGQVRLRGIKSIVEGKPLYVIDGLLYDELPQNVTPELIDGVTILKETEAVGLYGSRAADGAIIISTKTKNFRTKFRDYAFWQPQLFTDENGETKFVAEYPDNITSWSIYVIGMDRKNRSGEATRFVRSYKPVFAELKTPEFLIEGDSAQFTGKVMNYSENNYTIQTNFSDNNKTSLTSNQNLHQKESAIISLPVKASSSDTFHATLTIQTTTGFKDGEERKIPVFRKGTQESTGKFIILNRDTSFSISTIDSAKDLQLSIQNNTLDVLRDELKHLEDYPYACMEQTASKLKGLIAKKKIANALHEKFRENGQISFLMKRLQKNQLFVGGWSWWGEGRANVYITNYVLQSLLLLRGDVLIETNIRNGLLYLQNNLQNLDKSELLTTLCTLARAKHAVNYAPWIDKINFDSLDEHQKWTFVQLKQLLNFDHTNELKQLISNAHSDFLGAVHWGENNNSWYHNNASTTVTAYEVLKVENNYEEL